MKALFVLFAVGLLGISAAAQSSTPTPTPTPGVSAEVNVNISANTRQPVEQVSKTVDIIMGREMRERADFTLVDSLRTIPGFRVQQLGGFGRTANIKTRGLRNQDTAVLLDGIRYRDATAINGDATPFLSDLTLTSVDRIEVLRGSGSSLYGTNAIGGVIDFRTPESPSGTHGQISANGGGLGFARFRGNLSHGTSGQKFGISGAVARTIYSKGVDRDDAAHNTTLQTRVDVRPSSGTNLSGRILFTNADVKLNVDPDTAGTPPGSNRGVIAAVPGVNFVPDANDPDRVQRSRSFSGQVAFDQVLTDKLVAAGFYQGLKTRRRNDNGPLGPGFFQTTNTTFFDGEIHTGNAHLSWSPRFNNVTTGYEFELEKFGNRGVTPSGTGNFSTAARQSSHTFYLQDVVSLDDGRLQLAGGARLQKFSLASTLR